MTFELDGYEPIEIEASLEESENISATLDKITTPVATGRKKPQTRTGTVVKKPLQREGVMDPFATKN